MIREGQSTLIDSPINTAPVCKVCGQGALQKKKKFRMSGPVVVIGFLLLIPSVIGMLLGALLLFATGSAATQVGSGMKTEAKQNLIAAGLAESIAEKAVSHTLTDADKSNLTAEQIKAIEDADFSLKAQTVGAGAGTAIGGGIALFFMVCSFVGGLLGWILIMRKKVLQCAHCEAVVAAS
jgi:UPF0716 family protein affecting phage T7 exclusion